MHTQSLLSGYTPDAATFTLMKMETLDGKEHFATWKHTYLCLAGIRIFCGMSDKIQKVTVDKWLWCHTCKKCWQSIAEDESTAYEDLSANQNQDFNNTVI